MANITPLKAVFTGATPTGLAEMQATDTIPKAKLEPLVVADVSGAAPLVSPALTGTPTAPTPLTADNSTTLATTALVQAKIAANAPGLAPVQSVAGRTGVVTLAVADVSGAVNKAGDTGLGNMSMAALTAGTTQITDTTGLTYRTVRVLNSVGTAATGASFENSGGRFFIGIDNSTGSAVTAAGSYAAYYWVEANIPLIFATNNIERLRITPTGGLVMGTLTATSVNPGTYTVATLPAGTASAMVYATNGRKTGEGAGLGTGVLAIYTNGAWRDPSQAYAVVVA